MDDLIYYEAVCRYCKRPFKIVEGTVKYQQYKRNRNGKFACDTCERRVAADARKYLFNRD